MLRSARGPERPGSCRFFIIFIIDDRTDHIGSNLDEHSVMRSSNACALIQLSKTGSKVSDRQRCNGAIHDRQLSTSQAWRRSFGPSRGQGRTGRTGRGPILAVPRCYSCMGRSAVACVVPTPSPLSRPQREHASTPCLGREAPSGIPVAHAALRWGDPPASWTLPLLRSAIETIVSFH